jgi:hypothetical protein
LNVAVIDLLESMTKEQMPVPEHAPLHPENEAPLLGWTPSVT